MNESEADSKGMRRMGQHDPQIPFTALCFLRNRFFPPPSLPPGLELPENSIFSVARKENVPSTSEMYKNSANISPINFNNATVSVKRPRSEKKPIPDNQKDEKYFERRKRNNEAAKKSRDARKIREDRVN